LQDHAAASPIKPAFSAPATTRPLAQSSTETTPERIMPLPMAGFTYNPVPNKEELL